MSSVKLITLFVLIPGAGFNSYSVTTGPGLTISISPSTPNSLRAFDSLFLFSSIKSSGIIFLLFSFASFNKSRDGSSYPSGFDFTLIVFFSIIFGAAFLIGWVSSSLDIIFTCFGFSSFTIAFEALASFFTIFLLGNNALLPIIKEVIVNNRTKIFL